MKEVGPQTRLKLAAAHNALLDLYDAYGSSKTELARALSESPQTIHYCIKTKKVSKRLAVLIEHMIGGRFTKEYMRPDVPVWYPEFVEEVTADIPPIRATVK